MHILVAHPLYDWSVEAQQLGELFLRAVLPLLGVAGSVGHEVVIEEEKSVIIGSFKFWRGVRSKQKEGQATLEQESKNGSKEYKSPLSEK